MTATAITDGKAVVDISDPVDPQTFAPLTIEAGSAAQEIAGGVPGARVVKAFNTTFAGTLVEGPVAGSRSTSSSRPTTRTRGSCSNLPPTAACG